MTGKPSKFSQQNEHAAERKAEADTETPAVKEPQKDPAAPAVTEKTT